MGPTCPICKSHLQYSWVSWWSPRDWAKYIDVTVSCDPASLPYTCSYSFHTAPANIEGTLHIYPYPWILTFLTPLYFPQSGVMSGVIFINSVTDLSYSNRARVIFYNHFLTTLSWLFYYGMVKVSTWFWLHMPCFSQYIFVPMPQCVSSWSPFCSLCIFYLGYNLFSIWLQDVVATF